MCVTVSDLISLGFTFDFRPNVEDIPVRRELYFLRSRFPVERPLPVEEKTPEHLFTYTSDLRCRRPNVVGVETTKNFPFSVEVISDTQKDDTRQVPYQIYRVSQGTMEISVVIHDGGP